ncbi:MAG: metallophosphoesterase [Prevotella sp.]
MIARILIPIVLIIVLEDLYFFRFCLNALNSRKAAWASLFPGAAMIVFTVVLALQKDFAPTDGRMLNFYLFLLGLHVVPKFIFSLFSFAGRLLKRVFRLHRNYGNIVGLLSIALIWYVLFYGSFIGFDKLTVRHITYSSDALPAAFDGYRIVQFSDAHVGTYGNKESRQLATAIDSIHSLRPDMIVFTGDLQNMTPQEIMPHKSLLSSLRAADGVFSVLGNHDYADYIHADEAVKAENCRLTRSIEQEMGWTLLDNGHRIVRRGADSIVIAGMENDGNGKHFPQKGDVGKTLYGVTDSAFVVMLEHDPSAWRRKILPQSNAQLTLSGHTHAMQFEIFGWSPSSFVYNEWGGMYYEGERAINVSTGLGGFIPFRFGIPGEIVVITLKRGKPAQ